MVYDVAAIERMLQEYPALVNKTQLLRHELESPASVSFNELLTALAMGSSKCEPSCGTVVSYDKIMELVENYREKATIMNNEVIAQILNELSRVQRQLDRMDMYISLLSEEQKYVIKAYCIEGRTWRDIERETGYSRRTLCRRKAEGLAHLEYMYNYMSQFA